MAWRNRQIMGEWKKTQCNMCVLSCGLEMEVEDGRIINVRPDKSSPRSHGYCCRKGRTAKFYQDNPDRLNYPLKKVGDQFERISWEQALSEIGEKARHIIDLHGPRAVGMVGGTLAAAQSDLVFARSLLDVVGTQNYFNPIGIEFMGNWWSHGKVFGDQMHYLEPDDDNCEMLIFWGSNSYVSGQILNAREKIRSTSKSTDRILVSVDPRISETARMADLHIMPRMGSDSLMLRGMIALILKNGWQDSAYIAKYVKDFDSIRPWFDGFDIDESFRVSGVTRETMERFCRLLTTKKWGVHEDLGLFMGRHNTLNCYLMLILAVICGVALMPGGCIVPECSIKRGDFTDENDPKVWRSIKTNRFPVLGTFPESIIPDEILNDDPLRIRMMFVDSSNPARSYPDTKRMVEAFNALELMVCIDVCMTETARLADYVLPAKNGYEAYEINAFQYNYPEIVGHMRHPVIDEQIGERKEGGQIWIELARAMGVMPELPQWLYSAAEKAAAETDRLPYFMKLLAYAAGHMKYFPMLPMLVGETLGKYMGSPTRAVTWAAYMTSPIANKGMVEKAKIPPLGKHPVLEKLPGFAELCRLDAAYQLVDDMPQGAVIGISDPNTMIDRHIAHKDGKIHLYCDEINKYIQNVTPENEERELTLGGNFPLVLSSGRHSDDGVNWVMRNPKMNQYRNFFKLSVHPLDAKKLGVEDGEVVNLSTEAGTVEVIVEYTWQTAQGYVLLPHHYGIVSQGKSYGFSSNELVPGNHLDKLTGNPLLRYVPCRIDKLKQEA